MNPESSDTSDKIQQPSLSI